MGPKKQGLYGKQEDTMFELMAQGYSADDISDWLQVDADYVRDRMPPIEPVKRAPVKKAPAKKTPAKKPAARKPAAKK